MLGLNNIIIFVHFSVSQKKEAKTVPVINAFQSSLKDFEEELSIRNLSPHTVRSYLTAVRQLFGRQGELTESSLAAYKLFLMENYKARTVNQRIRAINCYLEFRNLSHLKLHMIHIQHNSCLDRMVSRGDYEYLTRRLWEDEKYSYYFLVRLLAATGVRVGELVKFTVEDAALGYKDILAKGNKVRRVYIPSALSAQIMRWLKKNGRKRGPLFLNQRKSPLSPGGIRYQFKAFAYRYHLDPAVMHPHAFRHLFAKNFLENNGDLSLLSDLLGHENIETTRIYLKRTCMEQQQIVDQVIHW